MDHPGRTHLYLGAGCPPSLIQVPPSLIQVPPSLIRALRTCRTRADMAVRPQQHAEVSFFYSSMLPERRLAAWPLTGFGPLQ
jgi:hypothetical protein